MFSFTDQGQENDIILISLVRSNKEGKIGYLSSMNRLCVAISRARCGLYLFGNQVHLANASRKGWKVGVPRCRVGSGSNKHGKKSHYIYLIKKTARLNVLLLNFGVKVDIQGTGNELFCFDSVVNLPGNR